MEDVDATDGSDSDDAEDGPDVPDAPDIPPDEGPWTCKVPPNVAVWLDTDWEVRCGMSKCIPGTGCKGGVYGTCKHSDDCIPSTLDLGWDADIKVFCNPKTDRCDPASHPPVRIPEDGE